MSETPEELMAALTAEAAHLPTKTLFQLAWAGLRVRLARSLVTLLSVVLAIAYLSYSGVSNDLVKRLAESKSDEIYTLLRAAGIDVEATAKGSPLDRWLVAMALLTCTVGIANAMLMSVTERFREIGTMKCLGAENGTVVKLFLIESAMIGGAGSLMGIVVGLLICVVAGAAQFGRYSIEYLTFGSIITYMGFAFLAGVVLCLIGAGYPALVASRMRPVEALRVEE
ncbi:MAG: ABC transporter permease [Candidatus Brocadiia bacterium]